MTPDQQSEQMIQLTFNEQRVAQTLRQALAAGEPVNIRELFPDFEDRLRAKRLVQLRVVGAVVEGERVRAKR